jgi:hypothetical protein
MRKVACLGNSHLAALKLGWEKIKVNYPQAECVFFGAHARADGRGGLADLVVEGDSLCAIDQGLKDNLSWTSGGRTSIRPAEFDAIVLCALGLNVLKITDLIYQYAPERYKMIGARYLISDDFYLEAIDSILKSTGAYDLVGKILKIENSAKIFVIPQPMVAQEAERKGTIWYRLMRFELDTLLAKDFSECINRLFRGKASIVEQPSSTLYNGILTRSEFSRGSVRLLPGFSHKHDETDHVHMNETYGVQVLGTVLEQISGI